MDDMQTIVFVDDEGAETVLTLIMALDYKDETYYAMTPDDEDTEEMGVVFLQRVEQDGEEIYEPVMDEKLEDELFGVFSDLLDE